MFREHKQHQQGHLSSTLSELPPGMREMLEKSWSATFRREVFERLDERPFAVLYAAADSRPNVPVNVLFGLEVLKSGFGWTGEQCSPYRTSRCTRPSSSISKYAMRWAMRIWGMATSPSARCTTFATD